MSEWTGGYLCSSKAPIIEILDSMHLVHMRGAQNVLKDDDDDDRGHFVNHRN